MFSKFPSSKQKYTMPTGQSPTGLPQHLGTDSTLGTYLLCAGKLSSSSDWQRGLSNLEITFRAEQKHEKSPTAKHSPCVHFIAQRHSCRGNSVTFSSVSALILQVLFLTNSGKLPPSPFPCLILELVTNVRV